MIHKCDSGDFVISSRGTYLPGSYADEQAARYAFQFEDGDLQRLQDAINARETDIAKRVITMKDLKRLRAEPDMAVK